MVAEIQHTASIGSEETGMPNNIDTTIEDELGQPTITADPGNYAVIPHWLITAVKPTTIVVYLAMRTWADNSTGHAFPKVKSIADRAGVSTITATRAIAELDEAGALRRDARHRSDGSQTSNSYHLSSHTSGPFERDGTHNDDKTRNGGTEESSLGGTEESSLAELDSYELESSVANAPSLHPESQTNKTPEITRLTRLLAELITNNGSKPPTITKTWTRDIERMHRIDGHTWEEIEGSIRWSQQDDFWCANIRSPRKLRKHFDQMRLTGQRQTTRTKGKTERTLELATQLTPELEQEIRAKAFGITTKTPISA